MLVIIVIMMSTIIYLNTKIHLIFNLGGAMTESLLLVYSMGLGGGLWMVKGNKNGGIVSWEGMELSDLQHGFYVVVWGAFGHLAAEIVQLHSLWAGTSVPLLVRQQSRVRGKSKHVKLAIKVIRTWPWFIFLVNIVGDMLRFTVVLVDDAVHEGSGRRREELRREIFTCLGFLFYIRW